MSIDQSVIREVLSRVDIGEHIGTYVQLHKRGRDLVGLCPFHGEKTPSFHVRPEHGFFKCFGCGAAGDAIAFHVKMENVPFPEALRALAKRVGVLVAEETPATARARSEKEAIYAANETAAAFFHRILCSDEAGAQARVYCERRGLRPETIEAFKIGYAPPGWQGLADALRVEGVDLALAEKAGLLKQGQRGYYDFYRGRLMIPTYAATGEVTAFGGRALGGEEPKYLNTSTTPVYIKGRGVFALNAARRAAVRSGAIIVVEGYLDCIVLHQAGFENAVASLGTAFTLEQASELRKYAERIFLCFDADAAGSNATRKALDVLAAAALVTRVVRLPEGEDPDSFVCARGALAFQEALDKAISSIEYKLDCGISEISTRDPFMIARDAEKLVRRESPREEWDRHRVYVASRLGLSPNDLRASRFLADPRSFLPRMTDLGVPLAVPAQPTRPIGIERDILMTLLDEPSLVKEYASEIPIQRFTDVVYRTVYEVLSARCTESATTADVFAMFAGDQASLELLAGLQKADRSSAVRFADTQARRAHLDRILERFAREDDERRRRELDLRIVECLSAGKQVPKEERDEYQHLIAKLESAARKRLGTKSYSTSPVT
jgi:DNA primase catalytic core